MPYACKLCIAQHGLRGSDIAKLPTTEDGLYDHIEAEHHLVVRRAGETDETAMARFLTAYPQLRTCDHCRARGAPWTQPEALQ